MSLARRACRPAPFICPLHSGKGLGWRRHLISDLRDSSLIGDWPSLQLSSILGFITRFCTNALSCMAAWAATPPDSYCHATARMRPPHPAPASGKQERNKQRMLGQVVCRRRAPWLHWRRRGRALPFTRQPVSHTVRIGMRAAERLESGDAARPAHAGTSPRVAALNVPSVVASQAA